MIETFFALDTLGTGGAFLAALIIGFLFGVALEQAGFGSSRRLSDIFYFRDMTVLKVMFTAVIAAMIGLSYMAVFGLINPDNVFHLPTFYGGQLLGGFIFGIGFVIGGWCPGTAAVGLASGRWDALLFLGGAVGGSILYNEVYPSVASLATWGDAGLSQIWEVLGISRGLFALLFTVVAILAFWASEWVERKVSGTGVLFNSRFLQGFSALLVIAALPLVFLPPTAVSAGGAAVAITAQTTTPFTETDLLTQVAEAGDHMEPEELADHLINGHPLLLVDLREAYEFATFHIRGAIHCNLSDLPTLLPNIPAGMMVVLYSNGMTHPAQARDSLARLGYTSVFLLTDGLTGFIERCLTPVSLRPSPLSPADEARVRQWRAWFIEGRGTAPVKTESSGQYELITPDVLAGKLQDSTVRIIDLRPQPEYNTAHIPGSVGLQVESIRGVVNGISSMLLPANLLAGHLSLMGIQPTDHVVIVSDTPRDATLVTMALRRVGHARVSLLEGGFARWKKEWRTVTSQLPVISATEYPAQSADGFSVDAAAVQSALKDEKTIILDVRSPENFRGESGDEARLGHMPGAINRPYKSDVKEVDGSNIFLPVNELAEAYRKLIPDQATPVIVHCRTGHQASQTFFVLRDLLGYTNVRWYDGGWTEWATRPELPVVK